MYRCRKKKKKKTIYIGKSVWRSVRQLKKLQARPPRPATIISRIRGTVSQLVHVCNNACKEIETRRGCSTQTAIRCTAAPAVGYSETLVESHVPSRILYISSIRFSPDLFFPLLTPYPPPFLPLLSLLATYSRFIYSHLLPSSIVTRLRHERQRIVQ